MNLQEGTGTIRILLVDDTEENRYTLSRHLKRAGYTVIEAASGEDALRELKNRPDMIICDVKLPDMSGLEISRKLRQDPSTRTIPILQISATFTLMSDRVKGLDAGADGYLTGPVEPDELLANVRMLLRLKEAQEALARSNEELERRVRERTAKLEEIVTDLETFSYSITHDMRAPLRAMQGFSRLLLESHSDRLDDEGRDYLERIANSANRLDLLIRDVLTYSNVVRSRFKLEPIDTEKLVRDILKEYPGLQPPEADIHIESPLPVVMGNEAFLTQCFSNLLGNALKFVPPKTTPRVRVSAEPYGDRIRLKVKDNGIGIAPEHQNRLFTLFHRAQNTHPGTGIGLAVVRKAVERMGGNVGVESAPGQGSTFWLELRTPESRLGAS